jgi:hypothetical protein
MPVSSSSYGNGLPERETPAFGEAMARQVKSETRNKSTSGLSRTRFHLSNFFKSPDWSWDYSAACAFAQRATALPEENAWYNPRVVFVLVTPLRGGGN